jgi:hypothetical protein
MLQRYSDNVTLLVHFALPHNALARWRKVIASSSFELLSHLKVIALLKFEPLTIWIYDINQCCASGSGRIQKYLQIRKRIRTGSKLSSVSN